MNYDFAEHRLSMQEKSWDRKRDLIVFDELHKMDNWKSWLKGIYDVEGISPQMIVTGSARLDLTRKVGDSLAGRFFQYRLHPLISKKQLVSSTLKNQWIACCVLEDFRSPSWKTMISIINAGRKRIWILC